MEYQLIRGQMRTIRDLLNGLGIPNGPADSDVIVPKTLNISQLRKIKESGVPVHVYVDFDRKRTTLKPSEKFHYFAYSRGKVIDQGLL